MNTQTSSPSFPEEGRKFYVYAVSVVAAVGGFLFGYDLAILSGAVILLKKAFALSDAMLGFAAGSALLGCAAGSAGGGWLADRVGRKRSFFVAVVLFGVSAVGTAIPKTIGTFCLYRAVGGVGVGLASVLSPMYIAEVSPARIRGRLVTLNQLAIVVGAISSIAAAYLLARGLPDEVSWRWMFASELVPILVFAAGLTLIPRSPRWLFQRGRAEEAYRVLCMIDGRRNAEAAVKEIEEEVSLETGRFTELFAPGVRVALLIGVALAFFQQWTGASPMGIYAPVIFQEAGFKTTTGALSQALVMHLFNLPCVLLAMWLVDRFGRRPLLLGGTLFMAGSLVLVGLVFMTAIPKYLVLPGMILTMLSYNLTLAPLVWLIISEIFPIRLRGKGMGVAAVVLWLSCYAVWQAFPIMAEFAKEKAGSMAPVFWFFAFLCAAAFLFGWVAVPETKDRTLEEIAAGWVKRGGGRRRRLL